MTGVLELDNHRILSAELQQVNTGDGRVTARRGTGTALRHKLSSATLPASRFCLTGACW